ncbi:MAG: asparaginase, partial [Pseudomonadota bacterium]
MTAHPLVSLWRGDFLESQHRGHVVVMHADGHIIESYGDPDHVILPRSSCKMIQALPLLESGAADRAGLTPAQLALACASHQGAAIHTTRVDRWLYDLGVGDDDLRCGPQMPNDIPARNALIQANAFPCRIHNNCSGKHAGFLTMVKDQGWGPEYHAPEHPLQRMVRDAFERAVGETSPGFGIDGCSAPNFACSITGLARAMAQFAGASEGPMVRLRDAMMAHPDLVAGDTRACTELMQACPGIAIKT